MINFNSFYQQIAVSELAPWLEVLPTQLKIWQEEQKRKTSSIKMAQLFAKLPNINPESISLTDVITVENHNLVPGEFELLEFLCMKFMPWRKGPYNLHGINIDTEWRSDLKWQRLLPHISNLENKMILDVGCGNGYHMWRMLEAKANTIVGIDPTTLFVYQFNLVKNLIKPTTAIDLIPVGIEQMPSLNAFDTVFSMGVLYHRISPLEHLIQLKNQLKIGGELVLESLIIDGDVNDILVPTDRYTKMRNVYFIPSVAALINLLAKAGFKNIRCVDQNVTSLEEQRKTSWLNSESLNDFLDPNDPTKTIEGYPAPKRAIILANK